VELRPQEDNPEEQRQNADALSLGLHVLTKTKLRLEWLRGQVPGLAECRFGYEGLDRSCKNSRPKRSTCKRDRR